MRVDNAAGADALLRIVRALNGNLTFGDGTSADNICGEWITYTSNAVADVEDTVAHTLGAVPIGYLVFSRDKAGICYKGSTPWTTSNLYLKSNVASTTYLIWIQLS